MKFRGGIFFIVFLVGCTSLSPTNDIETIDEFFARCPTADEINQVNTDLTLTFDYDPTANKDLVCMEATGTTGLTLLEKRVYQTVYVMRLLEFSRPLPWTEKPLYTWLTDTIEGMRFVNGGYSFCCDPPNMIVIGLNQDSDLLRTDEWVIDRTTDGLMNATLLYAHETRHNEGYHHNCELRTGDDNTLDEMGAWAVEYYLGVWISQYSNKDFLDTDDQNFNRLAAFEDAQITYLTRFCNETYKFPLPTWMP